jgi:MoaA/NifB/PqqE/SkfB family radical SAM enzyme
MPKKLEEDYFLEFAISSFCQAKCPSCNRTNPETLEQQSWLTPEHFNIDTFKKMMSPDYWRSRKITKIKFCGENGDPMMHPKIQEFIDHSFLLGARSLTIATNGGLRTPLWYKTMAEKYGKRLEIIFGIDGVTGEVSNKYRIGVDAARAYENMFAFHNAGGYATWQFILFSFNYHQLPELYEICSKNRIAPSIIWNQGHYGLIDADMKLEVLNKYGDVLDALRELQGEIVDELAEDIS